MDTIMIRYRFFVLFIAIFCISCWGSKTFAFAFQADGIYYNVLSSSEKTVEVIYNPLADVGEPYYSGNIIIPTTVSCQGVNYSVVAIGAFAFGFCTELESVTIPNSVTTIVKNSFINCFKLERIKIPSSVKTIETGAFSGCINMSSMVVEAGNTIYDSRNNCNAIINTSSNTLIAGCKNTTIPNTVEEIGDYSFDGCVNLQNVDIPKSVKVLGESCFESCISLLSISIPNNVSTIKKNAFKSCNALSSIDVIDGNRYYDSRNNCNAIIQTSSNKLIAGCKNTIIPQDIITIGENAFFNITPLTSINIPNSVTTIESNAFCKCELTSIIIPNSVRSIGDYAFSDCIHLNVVYSYIKTPFSMDGGVFWNISSDATLYVPKGTRSKYLNATGWHEFFANIVEMEETSQEFGLSIKATGYGSASYNSTTVRNTTKTFTVNEGTSATITFTPDNGYRIKSVKKNGSSVSVTNNQYTVSNIQSNTTVEVEFEAIPVTTYSLTVKATGNGYASFGGTTARNITKILTVNAGSSVTISFSPDNGYRIKSVKKNGTTVTSSVSNNQYTLSNIQSDTTVEVEFEVIPVTTYDLTISATGSGYASYSGSSIRNSSRSFYANAGSSPVITITPDNGYRIKTLKKNGSTVLSNHSSSYQYTVSNISANTTVAVEFEEIPVTTYTLSIKATGYGSASYNNTAVRNTTKSFTVNAGTSAVVTLSPDNGYRIKGVKKNSTDVTSSVSSNKYTVSNIQSNITVEVEFEMNYTLTIKSTGNGYASYHSTTIRNATKSFNVIYASSNIVTFSPDNGYKIKSVKQNGAILFSNVSQSRSEVFYIQGNITVEVEFETAPVTTYDLTISATGSGYVSYSGSSIRNSSRSFYVNAGTSPNLTITPDDGYRIKTLKKNGSTVLTNYSTSYQYTVSNISANTTVAVEFEAIPATTYSLTVKATGNGSASFASNTVRNGSKAISVNKGASVSISFTPDNGYHINYVRVNNVDRTSYVANYQYTVSNISANTSVEVDFAEDTKAFTYQNINYSVSSYPNKTIKLTKGSYGRVLEVPAKVTYQSTEWTVVGSEADALDGNESLAAVIWHPNASFTARASNPNLLLYVNDATNAQTTINNVIANGTAQSIILTDAASGNEFYCPQRFVAQNISYTHHYRMETGIDEARGWETLVLPFDVEKVTHESKGSAVPFVNWRSGDAARPFWLMQLDNSGWKEAESIKANRPYIISMPNNANYLDEFLLNGAVTFSAANATIDKTENLPSASYSGRTFIPNYAEIGMGDGAYALNVSNDIETNVSGMADGSRFVLNLRKVHPFEAYMTTTRATRSIDISEGMGIAVNNGDEERISVYNMKGMMMKTNTGDSMEEIRRSLPAGVYIINKRKVLVK